MGKAGYISNGYHTNEQGRVIHAYGELRLPCPAPRPGRRGGPCLRGAAPDGHPAAERCGSAGGGWHCRQVGHRPAVNHPCSASWWWVLSSPWPGLWGASLPSCGCGRPFRKTGPRPLPASLPLLRPFPVPGREHRPPGGWLGRLRHLNKQQPVSSIA